MKLQNVLQPDLSGALFVGLGFCNGTKKRERRADWLPKKEKNHSVKKWLIIN
jgi:hypothetical protein